MAKIEQEFPFMRPMSFDDFLVDLNQFYQGHDQVVDHQYEDNSQAFWNPEELYDETKKSLSASTDVDTYYQDKYDNELSTLGPKYDNELSTLAMMLCFDDAHAEKLIRTVLTPLLPTASIPKRYFGLQITT